MVTNDIIDILIFEKDLIVIRDMPDISTLAGYMRAANNIVDISILPVYLNPCKISVSSKRYHCYLHSHMISDSN